MMTCVLITSALAPTHSFPCLKLRDKNIRYFATKSSVMQWGISGIEKLIIADSTGETVLDDNEISILIDMGIEVEQLVFDYRNIDITKKGKGYAESLLLQDVFNNSILMRNTECFYKCSGKYICTNFDTIKNIVNSNNISSIFWRWGDSSQNLFMDFVDSRFYKCSKSLFISKVLPSLLMTNEEIGIIHEHCAYVAISDNLMKGFSTRPDIIGYCGGDAKFHRSCFYGDLESNFPCWYEFR